MLSARLALGPLIFPLAFVLFFSSFILSHPSRPPHVSPARRCTILFSPSPDFLSSELHSNRINSPPDFLLSYFLTFTTLELEAQPLSETFYLSLNLSNLTATNLSSLVITMPDLRRQIFESGKTVSRKAASREASRTNSRASSKQTSRQSSQNASRQGSDDEDSGFLSDDTALR